MLYEVITVDVTLLRDVERAAVVRAERDERPGALAGARAA